MHNNFYLYSMLPWQQFDVGCDYIHNLYTVLAKKWERGAAPLYAMPFPFDMVKGMQLNHKYALIFVSAPLC